MLNRRDTAAVLFALRYMQSNLSDPGTEDAYLDRCEEEQVRPLSADEIDDLCQRLNLDDPIVINLEGGMIISVRHPWACADVVTIDHDTGTDRSPAEVEAVPNDDGGTDNCIIWIDTIEKENPVVHPWVVRYLNTHMEDTDA